jgi:hypothetical protein
MNHGGKMNLPISQTYEYAREYHANLIQVAAESRQATRARSTRQQGWLAKFSEFAAALSMLASVVYDHFRQTVRLSGKERSIGVLDSTCC